jgi:hypothetical protein
MITNLWLDDGLGTTLTLGPLASGIALQGIDFTPSVRDAVEDKTNGDGSIDSTLYAGAGALTLSLTLFGATVRATLDHLGHFMSPSLRPYLYIEDSEWATGRRIQLRSDVASRPIQISKGLTRDVALQWKCPTGIWESEVSQTYQFWASLASTSGVAVTVANGVTMDVPNGVTMPASSTAADQMINNVGDVAQSFVAYLYGPAFGPELINDSTGQTFRFLPTYSLPAGSYIMLDMQNRKALLNSDPNSSVLAYRDFTASTWWSLGPGTSLVRFIVDSGSSASTAVTLSYRPGYYTGP